MKFYLQKFFLLSSVLFLSLGAWAQVDPTTSLLLQQSSPSDTRPNLDSSRYTVRSSQPGRAVKAESTSKTLEGTTDLVSKSVTKPSTKLKETTDIKIKSKTVSAPETVAAPAEVSDKDKSAIEVAREIILGGDEDALTKYREELNTEDTRQNLVSLSVAPNVMYVNSSSTYWYRNYYSFGPGVSAGADIWFSPFAGLNIDYATSLAADMTASPTSDKKTLVDHRFTNVGLQFRRYASLSRKSASVNFGIQYSEYQMSVPKGEAERIRVNSKGIGFSVYGSIPTSVTTSWVMGSEIVPKLSVTEESTAIKVKSGDSATAYSVKFSIGQNYTIDRKDQIFWRLSHRMDKTVYSGTANLNDPITGAAPESVSVTSGVTLFELGYTWGD